MPDTWTKNGPTAEINAEYNPAATGADQGQSAEIAALQAETVNLQIQINVLDAQVQAGIAVKKTVALTSAPIAKGAAIILVDGDTVTLATHAALVLVLYPSGVALTAASAGQEITVATQGIVDSSVVDIGAGTKCSVGLDDNGIPKRVLDPACTSGLRFLGDCDANGVLFISPRLATVFNALDFGLDNTGTTANDDTNDAMIAAMAGTQRTNTVYYPAGNYKWTRTVGPWPRGAIIKGDGWLDVLTGILQGTRFLCYGAGIGVELGHAPDANQGSGTIFQDIEVLGRLPTGFADAPNINQVGVDILGDVGVKVGHVRCYGFQFPFSVDGAQSVDIIDCQCAASNADLNLGYLDMGTLNPGGNTAATTHAVRIGSFNFTVSGSANAIRISNFTSIAAYGGIWHEDGVVHRVSNFVGELNRLATISGGLQIAWSDSTCEGCTDQNILVSGVGLGVGSAFQVYLENVQFDQHVPAINFDGSVALCGLTLQSCYFGQAQDWPVKNSTHMLTGPTVISGCTPPASGPGAGGFVDSFVNGGGSVPAGFSINNYAPPKATLDVMINENNFPYYRYFYSGGEEVHKLTTPDGESLFQRFLQLVGANNTSGVRARLGDSLATVVLQIADPPADICPTLIPGPFAAGLAFAIVTASRVGVTGNSAFWVFGQAFETDGSGVVTMLGAPFSIATHDFAGTYVAPTLTTDGGSNILVEATPNPGFAASFAAEIVVLTNNN